MAFRATLRGATLRGATPRVNINGDNSFYPAILPLKNVTGLYLRNTTLNAKTRGGTALFDLLTTAGSALNTVVTNTTVAGTEIPLTKTAGGSPAGWITPPFAVAVTITGADIAAWFSESSDLVNAGGRFRLYRWRAGVETEFTGSPADDGVEFTTTNALYTWLASLTALDFIVDDRLLLVPALINVGVMTMGTATLNFNGAVGLPMRLVQSKTVGSVGTADVTATFDFTPIAGNLLVAVHFTKGTTATRPAGFTQDLVVNNAVALDQLQICSRKVEVGDGSSYTFGSTPLDLNALTIEEWAPPSGKAWPAAPFDVSASTAITTAVSTLSTGTTATRTVADALSIAGAGLRGTVTAPSVNNNFTFEAQGQSDGGVIATTLTASRIETVTGVSQANLSWTTAADAMAGVVVYKTEDNQAASYLNVYPALTFKAEGGAQSAAIVEAVTAVESSSATATFNSSITEAVTTDSTQSATIVTSASIAESITAIDASTSNISTSATITEALASAETQDAFITKNASISESGTATETQTAQLAALSSISETVSASESQSASIITAATVTETVAAAETSSAANNTPAGITESIAASESNSATVTSNRGVTETLTANESSSNTLSTAATSTETVTANNTQTVTATFAASINETATASETQTNFLSTTATRTETATASETADATASGANNASIIETISVSDNVTASQITNVSITETVTASDASFTGNIISAFINEVLNATDSSTIIYKLVKRVVDSTLQIRDLGSSLIKRVFTSNLTQRQIGSDLSKRQVDSNLTERKPEDF